MVRIIWSPDAAADLEAICDFIAKYPEYYARLFAQGTVNSIERLLIFPGSGRIVPDHHQKDFREIIFQNYRIVYSIKSKAIEIVTITHGARLMDGK